MKVYFSAGKPVKGNLIPIPKTTLSNYSGIYGRPYVLYMNVKINDRNKLNEQNFKKFKEELKKYNATIDYFEVRENKAGKQYAIMSVRGYPLEFAPLVSALPALMQILGLTVIGITVYYVVKKHPLTAVILFIGLLVLIFALFGYKSGE